MVIKNLNLKNNMNNKLSREMYLVDCRALTDGCIFCEGPLFEGSVSVKINKKWAELSTLYCKKCEKPFLLSDAAYVTNTRFKIGAKKLCAKCGMPQHDTL